MTKRFSFEIKITGILLVVLTLVSLTGVFAYQRFSGIVNKISDSVRPDLRLLTAKALVNEINDAEISVKSFRISEDTVYLGAFYHAVERIEHEINLLQSLSNENASIEDRTELNQLDTLINSKIRVLNELLFLQDGFRTELALNKVTEVLEKSSEEMEIKPAEVKEKGRFDWLLNRKEKTEPFIDTLVSIDEINREVQGIKSEERQFQREFRERELELITEDQNLSEQIELFFQNLERNELAKIATENHEAEIAITNTNQQIALFCAVMGVLILLMAFIITNYVRNNNIYRKALKVAKEEAEDLARLKQKFLDNMSHEIRTPMNAIAGFSEQIGLGPLTTSQQDQLEMVQKSTDHLLFLINDVLDLSKLQADRIILEEIPFNPTELITEITRSFENQAAAKKLSLDYEVIDQIPTTLIGDPYRFRQIMLNILGNALKFTEQGGIHVTLKSETNDASNCILHITIEDTGIGIEPANLTKIFDEFEQAELSTTRNYGGSGLGLSIVKQLVELHQGKIIIQSSINEGTNVLLELPYKIGAEIIALEPEMKPTFSANQFKNLKILLVDDERFNRLLLMIILKKYAINYTEASNGEEAILELEKNDYDLILMDMRMPVIDGFQATKIIRKKANPQKSNVPIIAVTAAASDQNIANYNAIGINKILLKPFKEHELLEAILTCLDLPETTALEPKISPLKVESRINLDALRQLSGSDSLFYTEMLNTFLSSTEKGIIAIKENLLTENWESIADQAHKISSPCNHIGAQKLYQLLKTIENNCRELSDIDQLAHVIDKMEVEVKAVINAVNQEINKIEE